MPLQITSDNLELTESMKTLASQKLEKLDARIKNAEDDLVDIRVVLNKGQKEDTFLVKLEFILGSMKFYSEGVEYTLESAIIDAVDDVERQFDREVDKKNSEQWGKRREMKAYSEDSETIDDVEEPLEDLEEDSDN